jgi:hypothetical protein
MLVNSSKLNTQVLWAALAGVAISAIAMAASLPIIGVSAYFAVGLAAGMVSGTLCVFLIGYFISLALDRRRALLSSVGFITRIVIFSGVFYAALRFGGYETGAGYAIAFLAPYVGVALTRHLPSRKTDVYIYEDCLRNSAGQRRHVLVKNFEMVKYCGGRRFVTHRSFRKVKEVREAENA